MNWNQLSEYWQNLSVREQVLLLISVTAGSVIFLAMFVWEPLMVKRAELQVENSAAMIELNWMREQIPNIKALRGSREKRTDSGEALEEGAVNRLLQSSARSIGLSFQRFQPGKDNSIRVWVKNAHFNTLLQWLHEAEHEHNILITETNITNAKKEGRVNGQIQLTY